MLPVDEPALDEGEVILKVQLHGQPKLSPNKGIQIKQAENHQKVMRRHGATYMQVKCELYTCMGT